MIFALIALFSWGFGDFFIQRTSRKTGIVHALFYITVAASVVLLPFVWNDLQYLSADHIYLLLAAGVVILFTSLIQFQGFKIGKLAIVEPIMSLELPFTVLLACFIGHEYLAIPQYFLIVLVFLGIFLTVTPHSGVFKNYFRRLEKGTILAFISALGMALFNYLLGHASQQTTPLVAQWFTCTVMALGCLLLMIKSGELRRISSDFKKAPVVIVAETIFDNLAWVAYAFAVIYVPISIAITVSESYIILAVLLGLFFNKEKLKSHQYIGVVMAVVGVLLLAWVFGK